MREPNPWLTFIAGIIIGGAVVNIYHEVNEFLYEDQPPVYLCKNGVAYESVEKGSGVWIKTQLECIHNDLTMSGD